MMAKFEMARASRQRAVVTYKTRGGVRISIDTDHARLVKCEGRRVIVKVGSATITDYGQGMIRIGEEV